MRMPEPAVATALALDGTPFDAAPALRHHATARMD